MNDNRHDDYQPEPYWSDVAKRIAAREGHNLIAGDDEPYYRYKRKRFLEMLATLDVSGKRVLEVGPGPGGNLFELAKRKPAELHGVDISSDMIRLATETTRGLGVHLHKTDGGSLPFEDGYFDVVFSATVLQHNSDDDMMRGMLAEMCRVSGSQVALFEKVDARIKGDELCMARPVSYYADIAYTHGYQLQEVEHINIRASYLVSGAARKLLNAPSRKEGEPLSAISTLAQRVSLPLTRLIDPYWDSETDVAKMVFGRR